MYSENVNMSLKNLSTIWKDLCQMLKDYNPKDIFNCDEMDLF